MRGARLPPSLHRSSTPHRLGVFPKNNHICPPHPPSSHRGSSNSLPQLHHDTADPLGRRRLHTPVELRKTSPSHRIPPDKRINTPRARQDPPRRSHPPARRDSGCSHSERRTLLQSAETPRRTHKRSLQSAPLPPHRLAGPRTAPRAEVDHQATHRDKSPDRRSHRSSNSRAHKASRSRDCSHTPQKPTRQHPEPTATQALSRQHRPTMKAAIGPQFFHGFRNSCPYSCRGCTSYSVPMQLQLQEVVQHVLA